MVNFINKIKLEKIRELMEKQNLKLIRRQSFWAFLIQIM